MANTLTVKEIIKNYYDLDETFTIESFKQEIESGEISEDTEYNVFEAECNLDENGELWNDECIDEPWPYIKGQTFGISTLDNCFNVGYVYTIKP